jgi:hypothetical protein
LAKETGKRWQQLSPTERHRLWEKLASDQLQRYKAETEAYKNTQEYRNHQAYLSRFYALHPPPRASSVASETHGTNPTETIATPFEEPVRAFKSDLSETKLYEFDVPQESIISPLEAGMEEVDRISKALGVATRTSRANSFPTEATTAAAVRNFLNNTGSLLYLWSNDEARQLLKNVYHAEGSPNQLEVAELFAMAAIGSYCDGETSSTTSQPSIMDAFIHSMHMRPRFDHLHGMRLFACLAICRFINRAVSARKLMCMTFPCPSIDLDCHDLQLAQGLDSESEGKRSLPLIRRAQPTRSYLIGGLSFAASFS